MSISQCNEGSLLLTCWSRTCLGMTPINLLHYPFCPPDTVGNGAHRGRNPRSTVVLRQLAGREDAGGDQQHALATLVHQSSLAFSPFVRHSAAGRADARARTGGVCDGRADAKALSSWSQRLPAPLKRLSRPEPRLAAKPAPKSASTATVWEPSRSRHIPLLLWTPLGSASPAADLGRSASLREPCALGHGLNAAACLPHRPGP